MKANHRAGIRSREPRPEQILELTLAQLTMYLNELIENSPVAILMLEPKHRVQMCNPAFERLFQYDRQELMNSVLEDLITTKEFTTEAIGIWKRVLLRGKSLRFNTSLTDREAC